MLQVYKDCLCYSPQAEKEKYLLKFNLKLYHGLRYTSREIKITKQLEYGEKHFPFLTSVSLCICQHPQ